MKELALQQKIFVKEDFEQLKCKYKDINWILTA
jgi:hypothetical protein